MPPLRLVHLSDVHATARCRWRLRDFFSKRLTSWLNLRVRGRGRHFPRTREILLAVQAELRAAPPDAVVFSGDATALGFGEEIAAAAEWLGVGSPGLPPGFAVPGNHDYLTPAAARSGKFELAFGSWQVGQRLDGKRYPFARRVGPAWLVGVNSCVGNLLPQDARGRVGRGQLARLERLLDGLDDGPRILVTHYPVCRGDGRPDRHYHALRDLDDLVRVAERGRIALWLHGHRHDPYHLTPPGRSFPTVCAGSTTQLGVEAYFEYTIDGTRLHGRQRCYDPADGGFHDGPTFELELGPRLLPHSPEQP